MTAKQAEAIISRLLSIWHRVPWTVGAPKWSALRDALMADDPEALVYVTEHSDPKKVRARLRAMKQEAREAEYESRGIELWNFVHLGPAAIDRMGRGKRVWLYHGTTKKFASVIRRGGLTPSVNRIDAKQLGVYLTANPGSPGGALWYAERAAGFFGGQPLVVRCLVPYDALMWDTDDEDIESGNYQWIIDYVPPGMICEFGGQRIRGHC